MDQQSSSGSNIDECLKIARARQADYKQRMEQEEIKFWDLTKDDNHSADDELKQSTKARKMMGLHCILLQLNYLVQFLEIIAVETVDQARVPIKFLCDLFLQEELTTLSNVFKNYKHIIIDNSDEIEDVIKASDQKVKDYLVDLYEKQNESQSDKDSNWDTESQNSQVEDDDLLLADEKELEQIEREADEQEEEQELKEQQQQDQTEQSQQTENDAQQKQEEQKEQPPVSIETFTPPLKELRFHKLTVCQLAQNPVKKSQLASCSCDESFVVFDSTAQTQTIKSGLKETVSLISYSYDGKYLAIALINGNIIVYNLEKDFAQKSLDGLQSEPILLSWHPKGNALLSGGDDATLWLWNATNGDVMAVMAGHEGPIMCGGFTNDGRYVVSGSTDQTFRVWKPKTSEQAFKISGHGFHNDEVTCFSQHADQSIIATGSSDKTICLINFETGKTLNRSQVLESEIVQACFITTQHNVVACGDIKGNIYLLNLHLRLLDRIKIGEHSITKIIFDKPSTKFHASSLDGKLVNFDHRQPQHVNITQTPSPIYDFLLLGNNVLIGCEDGGLYVY